MADHEVERKRRPRVTTTVRFWPERRSAGVELILTRAGIAVSGFFDSFVGIEGGALTWEEFDILRAEVTGGLETATT